MSSPSRPLRNGPGLARGLVPLMVLISVHAEGHFLKVQRKAQPAKMQASLLSQKNEDPGWNRNYGVRSGPPAEDMGSVGDDGSKHDSDLGYNMWTADSMRLDFPFLDNMNPVAPMDRVNKGHGNFGMDAPYVSEYINPDAFPTVVGSGCKCTSPTTPDGKIECECGNSTDKDHYTWLKSEPIVGTNQYKLTPADITYRAGDYWQPHLRDGIVAPADAMPAHNYPNQAPANHISPLPATAAGDRVALKYSRYMDQVHDRAGECDPVSDKCTVECAPGDKVVMELGNSRVNAEITKAFAGNAAQVKIAPIIDPTVPQAAQVDCPQSAACTVFRFCQTSRGQCVPEREDDTHTWTGKLVVKHKCPAGTKVCKSVLQMVTADVLKKDGKTCKAAMKKFPKP